MTTTTRTTIPATIPSIWCSFPWQLDNGSWAQANYWHDDNSDTGWTVDSYGDGDHDEIDDPPSYEEVAAAEREYARHCLQTGEDPLDWFPVQQQRQVTERWHAEAHRSIIGVVITQLRRNGRLYLPGSVPQHVTDYLCLTPGNHALTHGCSLSWEELSQCPEFKPDRRFPRIQGRIDCRITRKVPVSSRKVAAAVRKAARAALAPSPRQPATSCATMHKSQRTP
jgi:hypothetical protein